MDIWKFGDKRFQHRIRTAGNRTPMQLYILGLIEYRNSGHVAIRDLYEPNTLVSNLKINLKTILSI
jgi:hypothetical protein